MPLKRLIYVSRATMPATPHDLQRLHALSERSNRRQDITGALGFTGRYFIQCIEGRAEAVDALMARIDTDPRHAEVVVLCTLDTDKRHFDQWSMRYFDSHALDEDAHQAHQSGQRDPAQAQRLIDRMTQTLPPGGTLHRV
ncbi:MAG TPA: BLUF domain-containing protein [Candidatus Aquabacterium excrementipullorum]|nr:BLUF domain-containing protein [Candidatus Aquabacterium excrementipullorum]